MDTVIRVSPEEFNEHLFEKIKLLLKNSANSKLVIEISARDKGNMVKEAASEYWTRVNRSIKEIEDGKGMSFTMKELDEYLHKHFRE